MKKEVELLEAARKGNVQIVQKLVLPPKSNAWTLATFGLKSRVNINCQDLSGYTPLHHAALNGHKEVVKVLLENSASTNIGDAKGSFPLHLASWNGNHEIVTVLLSQGPSIAKVNEKNGDNETALHCAAQHGHSETAEVLLKNGGDSSIRNVRGESPLDLASQYGRLDVVRLLLFHQPSLLKRFPETFSPLHVASRNGHKQIVELLIAHGADVNRSAENGTALHEAALFGKLEVVKLLLTRGANPHLPDPQNRTPLELVKQLDTQTSREISQLILERMQDGDDYEPLTTVANSSLTPAGLRGFLTAHSNSCQFLNDEDFTVVTPNITVDSHDEPSREPSRDNTNDDIKSGHASVNRSQTFKSFARGWSRHSIRKLGLKRSSSVQNSKSLPRLPSASRSPTSTASPELASRFHPSSTMFPVSSKMSKTAPTSISLLSLPAAVSSHRQFKQDRSSLFSEDDSVFIPTTTLPSSLPAYSVQRNPGFSSSTSPQSGPATPGSPPYSRRTGTVSEPSNSRLSSSPTLKPRKPARNKLSTITASPVTPASSSTSLPPPIPPKPIFLRGPIRPPSPNQPPPADDDLSLSSDEEVSDDKQTTSSLLHDPPPGRTLLASASPLYSPPSPHSAMMKVSEALQHVLPPHPVDLSEDKGEVALTNSDEAHLSDQSDELQTITNPADVPAVHSDLHFANSLSTHALSKPQAEEKLNSCGLKQGDVTRPPPVPQDEVLRASLSKQDTEGRLMSLINQNNRYESSIPEHEKLFSERETDKTAISKEQVTIESSASKEKVKSGYPEQKSFIELSSLEQNAAESFPVNQEDLNEPFGTSLENQAISSFPQQKIFTKQFTPEDGYQVQSSTPKEEETVYDSSQCYVKLQVRRARILTSQPVEDFAQNGSSRRESSASPCDDSENRLHLAAYSACDEQEPLVPTEGSGEAYEWDDSLSDRTEDFDMPSNIRKFRGLTRGSSYKSELTFAAQPLFDIPHQFVDDSDGSLDGARPASSREARANEDKADFAQEQDQTCTDGAHSTGSDEDSIVKLPDIDAIKDTVVAVRTRSQRGSKSESTPAAPSLPPRAEVGEEEWAQIADAMATIGGDLNRGSVYAKEFEQTFWKIMTGSSLPHHVGSWLSDIGLPQYEEVLETNGYDNLQFLTDSILSEKDLLDMDITDPAHRQRLLQAIKTISQPADATPAPTSVAEWLSEICLPQYESAFRSAGYHVMSQLHQLKADEIHQVIRKRGHAKRVIVSLQQLSTSQTNKAEAKSVPSRSSGEPIELKSAARARTPSYKSEVSLFVEADNSFTHHPEQDTDKENQPMNSLPTTVFDIPDTNRAKYLLSQTEGINLRPPNEATDEVSVSAWRHPQDILINSCCNYQAYYLGSMLIHELKGVESTKEACAKMKRSTDSMKKIPTITLSINYTGVKFIDFKSKHLIAEHEIQNISFASQDAVDLSTFAYITHDVKTGHHYCHVFRVTTMDMAYEIILTLGQAFEVAYQLILKEKSIKAST